MNTASAQLNNYRQSPRKVRLLADLIRGKKIAHATAALAFADKKAALPFQNLLKSAVANAKNLNLDTEALVVKEVSVNAGPILYRSLPMARGRAFRMRKRTSRLVIVLGEKASKAIAAPKEKVVTAKAKTPKAKKVSTK